MRQLQVAKCDTQQRFEHCISLLVQLIASRCVGLVRQNQPNARSITGLTRDVNGSITENVFLFTRSNRRAIRQRRGDLPQRRCGGPDPWSFCPEGFEEALEWYPHLHHMQMNCASNASTTDTASSVKQIAVCSVLCELTAHINAVVCVLFLASTGTFNSSKRDTSAV